MNAIAGHVRAARRPAGWTAPGPPPRTPRDRPELWPSEPEELCYLAGDWRILQRRDGHRWSLDDLATADFAAAAPAGDAEPRRILDLGCGIGAVLLLLAWRFPVARCVGIEAEAQSADLARRSVAWNGADDRCEVTIVDLRDAAAGDDDPYDLVTGTPPYLPRGTASEPRRPQQTFCHLEHRGGIEEYCAAAAHLMTAGGRLVACHPDHDRVDRAAAYARLVVEARREVIPRAGKRPLFALHRLRRNAAAAPRVDLPPLVVRDRRGNWTEEFCALRERMGLPPV